MEGGEETSDMGLKMHNYFPAFDLISFASSLISVRAFSILAKLCQVE
jgi:hypothetical protein